MTTPLLLDFNPTACGLLELIQEANRHHVAYHLVDDRLIVHPHRVRQDITDALIARAEEVADFLRAHGRAWRTPPEEDAYRRKMADEQCLQMFGMEWQALVNLAIDSLADRVGESWERHVARLPSVVQDSDAHQTVVRRLAPRDPASRGRTVVRL